MKKNGGFTLIELMIVVSIIMVVLAVAVPAFNAVRDVQRKAANEACDQTDFSCIESRKEQNDN